MSSLLADTKTLAIVILAIISIAVLAYVVQVVLPGTQSNQGVNLTVEFGPSSVFISHLGGEPLARDHLRFYLDGDEIPRDSVYIMDGQEWPFSIGETLIVPFTPIGRAQVFSISYDSRRSQDEIVSIYTPVREKSPTTLPTVVKPATPATTPAETTPAVPTTTTAAPTPTPILTPIPISTVGPPEAMFQASPREGPLPLTVQFSDQSTGVPGSWFWTFGDGTTSVEENPEHAYTQEGTFSVSLQVENSYGANRRIVQDCITVTPASPQDVSISAEMDGFIRPGGFAQFSITGPGSRVKIGGRIVSPGPGDVVRLVVLGDGKGSISISGGQITDYTFESGELWINGELARSGSVTEIYIPTFENFLTTFVLEIPPSTGSAWIKTPEKTEVLQDTREPVIVSQLQQDDFGQFLLDTRTPYQVTFRGAAGKILY